MTDFTVLPKSFFFFKSSGSADNNFLAILQNPLISGHFQIAGEDDILSILVHTRLIFWILLKFFFKFWISKVFSILTNEIIYQSELKEILKEYFIKAFTNANGPSVILDCISASKDLTFFNRGIRVINPLCYIPILYYRHWIGHI